MAWPKRLNLISFGCNILRWRMLERDWTAPENLRARNMFDFGEVEKNKTTRKTGLQKKINPPKQESRCKFRKSWGILYYISVNFISFSGRKASATLKHCWIDFSPESQGMDHGIMSSSRLTPLPAFQSPPGLCHRFLGQPGIPKLHPFTSHWWHGKGCKSHTLEMWQTWLNLIKKNKGIIHIISYHLSFPLSATTFLERTPLQCVNLKLSQLF